jgi:hypothetical protein
VSINRESPKTAAISMAMVVHEQFAGHGWFHLTCCRGQLTLSTTFVAMRRPMNRNSLSCALCMHPPFPSFSAIGPTQRFQLLQCLSMWTKLSDLFAVYVSALKHCTLNCCW